MDEARAGCLVSHLSAALGRPSAAGVQRKVPRSVYGSAKLRVRPTSRMESIERAASIGAQPGSASRICPFAALH